jgi:hypothetical protein
MPTIPFATLVLAIVPPALAQLTIAKLALQTSICKLVLIIMPVLPLRNAVTSTMQIQLRSSVQPVRVHVRFAQGQI